MFKHKTIDPIEYPRKIGESWWICHPNIAGSKFRLPDGAVTPCIEDFKEFKKGTVYSVIHSDQDGWVIVTSTIAQYSMPEYIFARHFDAEAFVTGSATLSEIANAKPFDGKSTVPKKPSRQLELFKDYR